MKKNLLIILTLLLIAVSAFTLVACDKYEYGPISGGDSKGVVLSNGGFAVKQGDYLYLVNGYDSEVNSNTFGSVVKGSIIRVKQNADGKIEGEPQIVVPKHAYWTEEKSGFEIFGDWIYYATPNVDRDGKGNASTTNLDFMRTSLDGTLTQLIYTVSSRAMRYWFMPDNYIVVYNNSKLTKINFSKLKSNKEYHKVSNKVTTATIDSDILSLMYIETPKYNAGQAERPSDYFYYTKAAKDTERYKNYNLLYAVKADGSNKKVIASEKTFDKPSTVTLNDIAVEENGDVALYYTRQVMEGGALKVAGVFVNKVTKGLKFTKDTEKCLSTIETKSTSVLYPINYEMGALLEDEKKNVYYLDGNNTFGDDKKIIGATGMKVRNISKNGGKYYVYYTASESPKSLFKINLIPLEGEAINAEQVLEKTFDVGWIDFDFIAQGDKVFMYYFDAEDYSYVYCYELTGNTEQKPQAIKIMSDKDKEAEKKKAEDKKNK